MRNSLTLLIKGLFLVTFVLFSFGQLGRINFLDGDAALYLYEIPLVALVVLLIVDYKNKPILHAFSKIKSLFIFAAVVLLTLLISFFSYTLQQNVIALFYFLRLSLYFLFFIYFIYFCNKEKKLLLEFKYLLFFPIGIIILTSVLQYFLYPDLRNLYYLGWDPHLYRVFGTFFEPVVAASIFGLTSIFLFINIGVHKQKALIYISIILLEILLLLTYARSAIISMFSVMAGYFLRKNIYYVLVIGLVLVISVILLPKKAGEGVNLLRTSTINSRLADYHEGWWLFAAKPLQGIGYNHIGFEKNAAKGNHAAAGFHSSFLIVLVTAGILGLVSFVFFLFELGKINTVAILSVVFLSIISLFDNILLHPFVLFALFSFIALSSRPSRSEL